MVLLLLYRRGEQKLLALQLLSFRNQRGLLLLFHLNMFRGIFHLPHPFPENLKQRGRALKSPACSAA